MWWTAFFSGRDGRAHSSRSDIGDVDGRVQQSAQLLHDVLLRGRQRCLQGLLDSRVFFASTTAIVTRSAMASKCEEAQCVDVVPHAFFFHEAPPVMAKTVLPQRFMHRWTGIV